MQSRSNITNRQRLALVAFTSLWLAACGGGGGGGDPATSAAAATPSEPSTASSPAPSPSPGAPATASGPAPSTGTSAPAAAAPSPTSPAPTAPPSPAITVQGTDGPDTLQASVHPAVMAGGKGDDIYLVTDPADVVIEQPGEGVDEVRTTVGYTLPDNVENMSAPGVASIAGLGSALIGNALNNRITGPAFGGVDIYGLEGDDILEGGIRASAYLDGGPGNDTLINNTGKSRGGPGADLFVVSARGAMTAPDVPLTILDFTPSEGDRIDGSFLGGGDPAALFASGNLQFDAANQRLVYTLDPARFAVQPFAVQQIILLPGVTSFDPAWIIRR